MLFFSESSFSTVSNSVSRLDTTSDTHNFELLFRVSMAKPLSWSITRTVVNWRENCYFNIFFFQIIMVMLSKSWNYLRVQQRKRARVLPSRILFLTIKSRYFRNTNMTNQNFNFQWKTKRLIIDTWKFYFKFIF